MIGGITLGPLISANNAREARPEEEAKAPDPLERGPSALESEIKAKREAEPQRDREFDEQSLDRAAERLLALNARLSIDSDKDLGNFIYRMVERGSGEVIRQFPHEEVLEMLRALKELDKRSIDEEA